MSRTRHASVFFCFALLATGCPDAGDSPDLGNDAGVFADAGKNVTSTSELAAGSGGRASHASSAGKAGSAASTGAAGAASAGAAGAAGQGGSPAASDDDAGAASPPATRECVVGGCSNQLCTDAARGPLVSTCEWREEYACYRAATCTQQSNGQCGWTMTPELMQCLQAAGRP